MNPGTTQLQPGRRRKRIKSSIYFAFFAKRVRWDWETPTNWNKTSISPFKKRKGLWAVTFPESHVPLAWPTKEGSCRDTKRVSLTSCATCPIPDTWTDCYCTNSSAAALLLVIVADRLQWTYCGGTTQPLIVRIFSKTVHVAFFRTIFRFHFKGSSIRDEIYRTFLLSQMLSGVRWHLLSLSMIFYTFP